MDPKLKAYLERMEARLEKRFTALEKKLEANTSDILEVVRSTGDNTSRLITRIENDYSYLRQHVDHVFKRVDYLEKKLLK